MEDNLKDTQIQENQNNVEPSKARKGKHADEKAKKIKGRRKGTLKEKREIKKNKLTTDSAMNNIKEINEKVTKILVGIIIILALLTFVLDIYYIYTKLIPKFKNIQIEIGYEKELNIKDFITNEKYLEDSRVLTDLRGIDLNKVRRT